MVSFNDTMLLRNESRYVMIILAKHNEEQKMFEEEMAEKLFRTEEENKLMNKHHDQTRQLEYNHMKVGNYHYVIIFDVIIFA